jgi:hypothetical protein
MEGLKRAFILGRERDIYFGMPSIEYVYQKISPDAFERIGKGEFFTKDVKVIAHFVYAGLLGGCERKDEAEDFSYGDVYEAVEQILFNGDRKNVMLAVGTAFGESQTVKWASSPSGKKKEVEKELEPIGAK